MDLPYVPDAGDVVWLDFDPQMGHEQAGHRPALVLSPAAYNGLTSLIVCCPMTSKIKDYPFVVVLSDNPPSAVLSDQVKSVDWRSRHASYMGKVTPDELETVRDNLSELLGLSWST